MSKEQIEPQAETSSSPFPTHFSDFSFLLARYIDLDDVVTQMLENVTGHLDALRNDIEVTRSKAIVDVRSYGNSMARTLLAGVEESITYVDLVAIIAEMKTGIAVRRVALMNNQEAQHAV